MSASVRTYHPNFSDPRTQSRVLTALGWAVGCLSTTKPHQWSTRFIDKHLGSQRNELSKWLRSQLLVTTNPNWSVEAHKCKEYTLNESGVRYLREQLELVKGSLTRPNTSSSKEDSCLNLIKEDKKEHNYYSIPYCSGSLDKTKTWDYLVVNRWVQREFAQELKDLNFDYDDKNHRLWHGLQNVRSTYRSLILSENGLPYQYDIDCSAPTLIYQHAQKLGMDIWPKAIVDYLENKQQIRQELAELTETNISTIKVVINALFCGARLGLNDSFAISHLLDKDPARILVLQQNEYVTQLKADIKDCWAYIEPTLPKIYTTTEKGTRKKPLNSKAKWNLYFELERTVLNSVRDYLYATGNKHFLEHDGWSCQQPIDQTELVKHIKQQTGYCVKLTEHKHTICSEKGE